MSQRNTSTSVPAQRVAMSNAERQRKHREKRKAELRLQWAEAAATA